MFCQYQRQGSAGSLSTIRTISGASQNSETMENVNGTPVEEQAPSTVIELNVDSQSSAVPSDPPEAADGRGLASITVSNILAQAEEEEELVQESSKDDSGDGREPEATVTDENNEEEQSQDTRKHQLETSAGETTCNPQTSVSDQAATDNRNAVDVVGDSAKTSVSDTAKMPVADDDESESEPSNAESSHSMKEDTLNETDTEVPVVSEKEAKTDQMSPKAVACLENSIMGGATVFNEDLVDVSSVSDQIQTSDADDSHEEPSHVAAPVSEDGEVAIKEEDKREDVEEKKNERQEMKGDQEKGETQEGSMTEKTRESEAKEEQVSDSVNLTLSAKKPEPCVTEPRECEQSSSISETTSADQQPSDTTPPSTAQEVASASTSHIQLSDTTDTTEEETPSNPAESSSAASSSYTQKSADSASKAKEIKIARLDVSNVALDTERLELKETSAAVCTFLIFLVSLLLVFYRMML